MVDSPLIRPFISWKIGIGGYLKIPWTKVAVKECHFLPLRTKAMMDRFSSVVNWSFCYCRDFLEGCMSNRQTLTTKYKLFQKSPKTTWVSKNAVFFSSSFTDPTRPVECEQENEGDMKNKSKSWLTSGELCVYTYIYISYLTYIYIYTWYLYHDMIYTYTCV